MASHGHVAHNASEIPAAEATPDNGAKALQSAAVSLSKGTWGTMGSTVGAILLAAGTWANSMETKISSALNKIDQQNMQIATMTGDLKAALGELKGLTRRMDRLEDRQERIRSGKHDSD